MNKITDAIGENSKRSPLDDNALVTQHPTYEFFRYVFASALALCVDYLSYWLFWNNSNLTLPEAAVIGYSLGLIVAYFLISQRIFKNGWLRKKKLLEAGLFILSGLLGLILTYLAVATYVTIFGENLHASKILATLISFIGVYLFRKYVVFRKSAF